MSALSLEERSREDRSRQAFLRALRAEARSSSGRAKVEIAADRIQDAAVAAARARQALRRGTIAVDKQWFWRFMNELLDEWRADASQARTARNEALASVIDARADRLCKDLAKIEERERLFLGDG
jgi:hypothetical protein